MTLVRSKVSPHYLYCNTYRFRAYKGAKPACTGHCIKYDELKGIVLDRLRRLFAEIVKDGGEAFRKSILDHRESVGNDQLTKTLNRLSAREAEINLIIKKLLEQNAAGVISDDAFAEMYATYAAEQRNIVIGIQEAKAELSDSERTDDYIERFLALVDKYKNMKELTRDMLTDLIEKIVVCEANVSYKKRSIEREQRIDFYYRYLGKLDDSYFR